MSDPLTMAKADAVASRTQKIIQSGARPEWLYLIRENGGFLTRNHPSYKGPCILLFTSPILTQDYMREVGSKGDVGKIKVKNLPTAGPKWIAAGLTDFHLNYCPRCNAALLYKADLLLDVEKVIRCWAMVQATRDTQAAALLLESTEYERQGLLAPARVILERIRDHVAYDVPYVHQMIVFLAGMQRDEAAKASAAKKLEEFGPEFALHPESWVEQLAKAQVGLRMAFGLRLANDPGDH